MCFWEVKRPVGTEAVPFQASVQIRIVCWQVRGKYDTIEAMLYKETGQYGKQIGDFFSFNAWSTFPLEGVLEAAIERQKAELDRVGADYKEAAGFRLNQFFGLLFVTIEF